MCDAIISWIELRSGMHGTRAIEFDSLVPSSGIKRLFGVWSTNQIFKTPDFIFLLLYSLVIKLIHKIFYMSTYHNFSMPIIILCVFKSNIIGYSPAFVVNPPTVSLYHILIEKSTLFMFKNLNKYYISNNSIALNM